mgnify:CR=1 FL=1
MVKILAASGLIVAGITITIFMAPSGPCDPIKNPKPPPFSSPRGEGFGLDRSSGGGNLDWLKDIKCGLFNPSDSSKETQASPSAEPTEDSSTGSGVSKTRLKAAFTKGSLRKSTKIEIRGNVSVEIKKDGTSSENLFDWLPIKVVLKAGSQKVWEAEVTKESGCREYFHNQYCTLVDYKYDPAWDGKKLYLYAYDKNGEWLAFYYEE